MKATIFLFLDFYYKNLDICYKNKEICIYFIQDNEVIFEYAPYAKVLKVENHIFNMLNIHFDLKDYEIIDIIREWLTLKFNYTFKVIQKFHKPINYIVEEWYNNENLTILKNDNIKQKSETQLFKKIIKSIITYFQHPYLNQ